MPRVLRQQVDRQAHTSIMSHSPCHFIARVSLAKRPRPSLGQRRISDIMLMWPIGAAPGRDYVLTIVLKMIYGVHMQAQIHKNITCEMYSCVCLRRCTKMDVQTVAVSVIFEFSGNKFELGENKFERERETEIFSNDKYFGRVIIFRKNIIFERENILKSESSFLYRRD